MWSFENVDWDVGAVVHGLTPHSVDLLVGLALPSTVRIVKMVPHVGCGCQACVALHLLSLVVCQALAHRCGGQFLLGSEAR
jgi:hypothetical protein